MALLDDEQEEKEKDLKKKEKQHGQTQTYTSIQLTLSLRDRLKDLGKKGESYEDIIERLLEVYQQTREGK